MLIYSLCIRENFVNMPTCFYLSCEGGVADGLYPVLMSLNALSNIHQKLMNDLYSWHPLLPLIYPTSKP